MSQDGQENLLNRKHDNIFTANSLLRYEEHSLKAAKSNIGMHRFSVSPTQIRENEKQRFTSLNRTISKTKLPLKSRLC